MENLFLEIMRQIGEQMPELRTIDEDYGQLAYDENAGAYPVIFPAALVGNISLDWTTRGSIQQGTGTLLVRLAIDCYDDTHLGSGTEDKIAERQQMNGRLCRALHNFQPLPEMGALERTRSVDYTLQGPGNIKVYETTFAFEVVDRGVATPL
ncbi:MAG: hypothetical protein LBV18_03975 [Alistipes sp.]|jgi:hypothetical protein|nr:hypothetical protein [Alistipes sp.]